MIFLTNRSITTLKGIGEKRAQLFSKLGVADVDALLYFFPRDYLDLSAPCSPLDAPFGEVCAVRATVATPVKEARIRKGMTLYRFNAVEDGITLKITLFNNPYLAQKIKENQEYIFYGTVTGGLLIREMSSPDILPVNKAYIRPIYPATSGLPSYQIENTVRQALAFADEIDDPIPYYIRKRYNLMPLATALKNIHFPESLAMLKTARRRLMFQEMLMLQCGLQVIGSRNQNTGAVVIDKDLSDEFLGRLPFSMTDAQLRAVKEAVSDMKSGRQMNRLLQGDVGSGKTAVAASLCYTVCKNGHQAALMAPTEILAEQHMESLCALFEGTGINIALLTGSTTQKKRREILFALAAGEIDLLVGTHAILEESVSFADLALVITDEQHRFGVKQRAALARKSQAPHILVMSATPIPRTLALIVYGDLAISVLDELPKGRQPIDTRLITTEKRALAFDFIKKQLEKGRQAYIVCPLIEGNDSDLVPVLEYYEKLQKDIFCNNKLGLLHGRMKSKEKENVMRGFSSGEFQLLVSTTVVEVGVDVPNATVMMIENADRFGLSQLHQLRGRVGRGSYRSYCILVSDAQNDTSLERLKVLCSTNDGFEIAEADLKSRGPGDFFGNRQHGLPTLRLTDMIQDREALIFTQQVAREILDSDPELSQAENQPLQKAMKKMFEEIKGGLN